MERELAKALLSIRAVFLRPDEPFTWASGIKSPIYCDNRLILTAPKVRELVETTIAQKVRSLYPEAEVLMGTSTAGIAHAAIAAHMLGMPMGYVRGRVIEDLISTGGSCIDVVEALREAGADVLGVVSIFTYGMQKGLDRLKAANVENHSLSNFNTLVEVAVKENYIAAEDADRLRRFMANPSDESWMNK